MRLGTELAKARKAAGIKNQVHMAERIGVKRSTVQSIERGEPRSKATLTIREYARIVGWDDGSVDAVLAGGDPTLATEPRRLQAGEDAEQETPEPSSAPAIPLRIVAEFREGDVLDTTVMDLSRPGSRSRMVVVVMGPPDATVEEVRRDVETWRKTERVLRDLELPDDDDPSAAGA